MKWLCLTCRYVCVATIVLLGLATSAHADVLLLKSGKRIDGTILETTKEYVKIDVNGSPLFFEHKYIKEVNPGTETAPAVQSAEPVIQSPSPTITASTNDQRLAADELAKLINENAQLKEKTRVQDAAYNKQLADLYSQLGMYPEAICAYEAALAADPSDADAHFKLAAIFEDHQKDYRNAIAHYIAYLTLVPDAYDRDDIEEEIALLRKKN